MKSFRTFCALCCATLLPIAGFAQSKWVWVGEAGSEDAPGNWGTLSNWAADAAGGEAPAVYPQSPSGGNDLRWLPIEITGTEVAPVYVQAGSNTPIEGWTFRLELSYAHVALNGSLAKFQGGEQYIRLRDGSTFTLSTSDDSFGKWAVRELDVGDGCAFNVTRNIQGVGTEYAFQVDLHETGEMSMASWTPPQNVTLSFALPAVGVSELGIVQRRDLITWTGDTFNLTPVVGTVSIPDGLSVTARPADTDEVLTEGTVSTSEPGTYRVVKDTAEKVIYVLYVPAESAQTLWTREQTAADDNAGTSAFYAQMDSALLSGAAADELPETVGLRQVTLTWRSSSQTATNPDRVRYLTVTEGRNEIGWSRALTAAPAAGGKSTFVFDNLTIAKGTLYTFCFRDASGEPLANVGVRLKGETTAQSSGLYVDGLTAYMPVVSFVLGEALPSDPAQTLTQANASDNGNYDGFCARLNSPLLTRAPEGLTLPVPTQVHKLTVRWRDPPTSGGNGGNAGTVRYAVIRDADGAEVARSTKLAVAPANGSSSTFVFREALLDPAAVYTYAFLNDSGGEVTSVGLRVGRRNESNESSGLYVVGANVVGVETWPPVVTFTVAEPDFAALAEADHRYAFDSGTLEDTGTAASKATLTAENDPAYGDVSSETGVSGDQALTQGTPWGGLSLPDGAWTVTAALKTGNVQAYTLLWAFGTTGGTKLTVSAGSRPDEIVLSTATSDAAVTPLVSVQVPGIGEHFSLLGIGRSGSVLTVTVNGRPVATADWPLTGAVSNFQIGSINGGVGNSGLTRLSGTTGYELADFRVFNRTLSDAAYDAVCAGAFRLLRRREAATAAEALSTADGALWQSPDGLTAAYPTAAAVAATLTAEAVVTGSATLESVLKAVQEATLTAAQLTVHGDALTYTPTDLEGLTGYTLPASAPPLWLSGSLTVTLSDMLMQQFVAAWLSDPSTAIPLGPAPIYAAVSVPGLPAGFSPKLTETAEGTTALTLESDTGALRFGQLNMRIGNVALVAGTDYGLDGWTVPGRLWTTRTFGGGSGISQEVTMAPGSLTDSVTGTADTRVGLELTLGGYWYTDGIADRLMHGYCEGSTRMVWSGLEPGVPYDVAIYFAATGTPRSPVRVKGATDVYWTYAGGRLSSFETEETVISADRAWGSNKTDGWEAGTNAAVLTGLLPAADGTLTLEVYSDATPDLGWSVEGVTDNHLCGVQIRPNADAPAPSIYTRTLTGGTEPWVAAGAWTNLADGTATDEPPAGAPLMLTLTADTTVTVDEVIEIASLTVVGSGRLTLKPSAGMLPFYDLFTTGSAEFTLVRGCVDAGVIDVDLSGAFGADGKVSVTENGISVTLTMPPTKPLLSVNFTNTNQILADGSAEGLWPVTGNLWYQYGTAEGTETLENGVGFAWHGEMFGGSYNAERMTSVIQKGRLDDGGSTESNPLWVEFTGLDALTGGGPYTAAVYLGSDAASDAFAPFRVEQDGVGQGFYTASADGTAIAGDGWWGDAAVSALSPGDNVLLLKGLTGETLRLSSWRGAGTSDGRSRSRGVVAALQIAVAEPYSAAWTAEASGEVSSDDLEWIGAEGQSGNPDANDALLLTLTGDTVLDASSGLPGGLIAVAGNGYRLTVTNHDGVTVPWRFSSDTRYVLRSDADTLPGSVETYPGVVVYAYDYTGTFEATTFPLTEFEAGFHGRLSRAGDAEIWFTGGEAVLPHLGYGSGEGRGRLKIVLSGDVKVIGGIGSDDGTDYRMVRLAGVDLEMRDQAYLETDVLRLGENTSAEGGAATLTMEDDAVIRVTDSRTLPTNQNPVILAHWNTDTTVTLRGSARLLAEKTYIQLCRDGRCTLSVGNNALVKTLGVQRYTGNPQRGIVELSGNGRLEVADSYQLGGTEAEAPELHLLGPQAGDPADAVATLAFSEDGGKLKSVPRFGTYPAQPLRLEAAEGVTFTVGNFDEWPLGSEADARVAYPLIGGEGAVVLRVRAEGLDKVVLDGGELGISGGNQFVRDLEVRPGSRIRRIVSESITEGGYVTMAELPEPDSETMRNLSFSLWLDPLRPENSRLLSRYPLLLDADAPAGTDNLSPVYGAAFSVHNNTNNAISSAVLNLGMADGQYGYHAVLKGTEVVRTREIAVGAEGYTLEQGALSDYSQIRFTGLVDGAVITSPAGGIALNYSAFAGSYPLTLRAEGDTPYTLIRGKSVVLSTDVRFDLSAWKDALEEQARGAVRGLPVAVCLISGSVELGGSTLESRVEVTFGEGVSLSLPSGVEGSLAHTDDGLYYVFASDTRLARSVPVAFTEAGTAVTSPAAPGVWPVMHTSWNVLSGSWTSDVLTLADAAGGNAGRAVRTDAAADGNGTVETPTAIYTYMKDVGANDAAATAFFRRWAETGAQTQTVTVTGVPFAAYRVAVTLAAEEASDGFAPVTVNGTALTMDADEPYARSVGDTAWGDAAETSGTVLSENTVISGVFTAPTATVTLEPTVPGVLGSGLAAIQIIEAPESAAAAAAQAFSHTFTAGGEQNLASLNLTVGGTPATWVSGPENTLTLDCGGYDVALTVPAGFMAKTVTASNGSLTLKMDGDSRTAAIGTLDCSGLTDVTVNIDVLGTAFTAPTTGKATFNALFDNAGQAYTIAAGQTLALGADSGITTNMDSALTGTGTGLLTINVSGSAGTLRRDYPVTNAAADVRNLTVAYGNGTLATDGTVNWYTPLCLDDGDTVYRSDASLWVIGSDTPYQYTQTGGTLRFNNPLATGNNTGFLAGPYPSQRANITANISGGRLETAALLAWHGSMTVNLSGGTVALGNKIHAEEAGRPFVMNVSGEGTLEVLGQTLSKGGDGPVTVTFTGGRITVAQATGTITAPLVFSAAETTPTRIAPPTDSVLVLNAANSGSGWLLAESGTLAAANAAALGSATVTVGPGATFEGRVSGGITSGTLKLQAGATLSVSGFDGAADVASYRFAGSIVLEGGVTEDEITFMRNGVRCSGTIAGDTGTVTFGEVAAGRSLTWAVTDGTWAVGEASPWSPAQAFRNGDSVTFPAIAGATAEDPAEVTVVGNVMPAAFAVTATDDAAHNTYRFVGADANARVTVPGVASLTLPPQIYDVPVIAPAATAFTLGTGAAGSTVRLFGTSLANGTATFSGVYTPATDTPTIVLTPHAGETQNLSALKANLRGGADLTVRGQGRQADGTYAGGTVNLSSAEINDLYSGSLTVEEGARLTLKKLGDEPAKDALLFASDFWTVSGTAEDAPITVRSGGTVEFLSRQIWMGWQDGFPEGRIQSVLVRLEEDGTLVDSSTGNDWFGHQLVFAGDNAAAEFRGEAVRWVRGAGFRALRLSEPADEENPLPEGEEPAAVPYTATVRSSHANGLILDDSYSSLAERSVAVEEGAALRLDCNLSGTTSYPLTKSGAGRLLLEYPTVTGNFNLNVNEGSLGGTARLSSAATTVTIAGGACVEAGLDICDLKMDTGAILAIDPTGNTLLRADTVTFGSTVTVVAMPDATIPASAGRAPVRVMTWNAGDGAASVGFTLAQDLADAGYALEVRADGLYLKAAEQWVRELTIDGDLQATDDRYVFSWFVPGRWQGPDYATTGELTDYAPASDAAATVTFVLPDALANDLRPIDITLSREVRVASVRFVSRTEAGGESVETELLPSVTYSYDLSSVKPAQGASETVTWMPTLRVGASSRAATVVASNVAAGYAASVTSNTVTVYPTGGTADVLNINFGASVTGAAPTIDGSVTAAGVVPFDGIYWNNASVLADQRVYTEGDRRVFRTTARILGRSATEDDPNANTVDVRYLVTGDPATISDRRTYANSRLTAGFLRGSTADASSVLTTAGLAVPTAANGAQFGWMVRIDRLPYRFYDLILIFAGEGDAAVTYPAVQLRLGEGDWRVYTYRDGFTVPSGPATWAGQAAPAAGRLENGLNYLRLRIDAGEGVDALTVAPFDSALPNAGAVGLAALQIVPTVDANGNADAAWLTRTSGGSWTVGDWKKVTAANPEGVNTAWVDATPDQPYGAVIGGAMTVDTPIRAAWVRPTAELSVGSEDGAVATASALDLTALPENTTVTLREYPFDDTLGVVFGRNVTLSLTSEVSGATLNWPWDSTAVEGAEASTLRVSVPAGERLTLTQQIDAVLDIASGELCLDSDTSYIRNQAVTGTAGTLVKRGSGRVTIASGTLNPGNATPVIVEEGTLEITAKINNSLPSGSTLLASGGELYINPPGASYNALPTNTLLRAEAGGTIALTKDNPFTSAMPDVALDSGTLATVAGADYHVHVNDVRMAGTSAITLRNNSQAVWNNEGLVIHGNLFLEGGTHTASGQGGSANGLKFYHGTQSRIVYLSDGASMDCGLALTSGDTAQALTISGAGTWRQSVSINKNAGTFKASPLTLTDGVEFIYALGGRNHDVFSDSDDTRSTVTVKDGATFSGNVILDKKSPLVIEGSDGDAEAGVLRGGVPGVAASSVTIRNGNVLTVKDGAVLEFDLTKTVPAIVFGDVSDTVAASTAEWGSDIRVRLTNYSGFTVPDAGKCLIRWGATNAGAAVAQTTVDTWLCPEAVALGAKLVVRDNGLYLDPDASASVWTAGAGTDTKWNTTTNWSTPPAGMTGSVRLTTPAGADATATLFSDGDSHPAAKDVIFDVASGRTFTLASDATTPKRLDVYGELWKVGAGKAAVNAPVVFADSASGAVAVGGGTLTVSTPIQSVDGTQTSASVPGTVTVESGATLEFSALPADNATQTLAGALDGTGTLRVVGTDSVTTTVAVKQAETGALAYDVGANGELSLTASPTVSQTVLTTTGRTMTVAAGGTVSADGAMALDGSAAWTVTLNGGTATEDNPAAPAATLTLSGPTVFAGTVKATGNAVLSGSGELAGSLVVNTPEADDTLTVQAGLDAYEGIAGAVRKTGLGTLLLGTASTYGVGFPLTVEAGRVDVRGTVSINDAAADWTFLEGTALHAAAGIALNGGTLTVGSGATMIAAQDIAVSNPMVFEPGSALVLAAKADGTPATLRYNDLHASGTVTIDLDAIVLDDLNQTGADGQAVTSYALVVGNADAERSGGRCFVLGGARVTAFINAGWILRDDGTAVTLTKHGAGVTALTYTGTTAPYNWSGVNWLGLDYDSSKGEQAIQAWPEAADGGEYGVRFDEAYTDPATSASVPIGADARTVTWDLGARNLYALSVSNTAAGGEYTLALSGSDGPTLSGDAMKSGDGNLTVGWPLAFASGSSYGLTLLGGTTTLEKNFGGNFSGPMTLMGEGTVLDLAEATGTTVLSGTLLGDAGATLRKSGGAALTLGMATKGQLKALDLQAGVTTLTVADGAAPVTLGKNATLAFSPAAALDSATPTTVALDVNVPAENATATLAGTFSWRARAAVAEGRVPTLGGTLNVATFDYAPLSGHLLLPAGNAVLPERVAWKIGGTSPTTALWLEGPTVAGALTGKGEISVNPVVHAGDAEGTRALTLRMTESGTFDGFFRGTDTISPSLTLEKADTAAADVTPRLTLTGATSAAYLPGTLTVGAGTEAEVNGTWAGNVFVAEDGMLLGRGTVASSGRTVTVAEEGGALCAAAMATYKGPNGDSVTDLRAADLTVAGALRLNSGSVLQVVLQTDWVNNQVPLVSCVTAETLNLPSIDNDGTAEIKLDVVLSREDKFTVSSAPILRWTTLNGALAVNGRVYDTWAKYEEAQALRKDGKPEAAKALESKDFLLRQEGNTLLIRSTGNRFWMFIR